MALQKIKGQNFRALVNGAVVTEAQSCQVQIQGNLEDASTKDSTSGYSQEQMTARGWTVQVDHVDSSVATLRALITRFNSDAKTPVGWDQTAGASNAVKQNAAFARQGDAILQTLQITANNRTTTTVQCSYQGSGPLTNPNA